MLLDTTRTINAALTSVFSTLGKSGTSKTTGSSGGSKTAGIGGGAASDRFRDPNTIATLTGRSTEQGQQVSQTSGDASEAQNEKAKVGSEISQALDNYITAGAKVSESERAVGDIDAEIAGIVAQITKAKSTSQTITYEPNPGGVGSKPVQNKDTVDVAALEAQKIQLEGDKKKAETDRDAAKIDEENAYKEVIAAIIKEGVTGQRLIELLSLVDRLRGDKANTDQLLGQEKAKPEKPPEKPSGSSGSSGGEDVPPFPIE